MADTKQGRLSEMCVQLAAQIGLIVKLTGAFDESKGADLIYQYVRNFIHAEDDRDSGDKPKGDGRG